MLKKFALFLLNMYQDYIRLALPSCCRFQPSCSEYAKQAIVKYGVLAGGFLGLKRLCHCHPFSGKSGYYPLE